MQDFCYCIFDNIGRGISITGKVGCVTDNEKIKNKYTRE